MPPLLLISVPQRGKISKKSESLTCFPQGHSLGSPSGQSPQSPIWHFNWQVWIPHGYNLLQSFSHCQTKSSQLRSWTLFPHKQICLLFFEHGGHLFLSWQIRPHTWMPHFNFNLHYKKEINGSSNGTKNFRQNTDLGHAFPSLLCATHWLCIGWAT